jgi:hypothetical protein
MTVFNKDNASVVFGKHRWELQMSYLDRPKRQSVDPILRIAIENIKELLKSETNYKKRKHLASAGIELNNILLRS